MNDLILMQEGRYKNTNKKKILVLYRELGTAENKYCGVDDFPFYICRKKDNPD